MTNTKTKTITEYERVTTNEQYTVQNLCREYPKTPIRTATLQTNAGLSRKQTINIMKLINDTQPQYHLQRDDNGYTLTYKPPQRKTKNEEA